MSELSAFPEGGASQGAPPTFPREDLASPVLRPSVAFPVAGRELTLVSMGGKDLVEWGEMKLLLGKEMVAAKQLCRLGKDHHAKIAAETVLLGNYGLVCRATGCDPSWAKDLSFPERAEIISRQDALNRTDLLEPWVEGFAVDAFLRPEGDTAQ